MFTLFKEQYQYNAPNLNLNPLSELRRLLNTSLGDHRELPHYEIQRFRIGYRLDTR